MLARDCCLPAGSLYSGQEILGEQQEVCLHISGCVFLKPHKLAWDISEREMNISNFSGCMFFSIENTVVTFVVQLICLVWPKGKHGISGLWLFIIVQNSD